jgi:hypothetical protein
MNYRRFPFLSCFVFVAILITGPVAGVAGDEKVFVDFHNIHRDGKVAVLGHFGIPIGQIVTVEGKLAEASKVSNDKTLRFTKVNGVAVAKDESGRWPSLIQIQNVDSLPKHEPIVVEGYEFLSWRGDPQINWHVEVAFIITKVVAPKGLKVNAWKP